jgi:glucuronate isomerase
MVMQLHFATYRNVNTAMFGRVGRDAGFDIMRGEVDTDRLVVFLDTLNRGGNLPKTVLYTLNPACVPALCTLSGAFPNVRIGAAWWFNDTVEGIRRQIKLAAEYTALGVSLGMLTDSRSFASYARFDFFRRILADVVGEWVESGEYAMEHARKLMYDVCYGNVKEFLGL